jgi:hypothetical protein
MSSQQMSRTHRANDPHGSRGVHTSLGSQIVAAVLFWALLSMACPGSLHASVGKIQVHHHIDDMRVAAVGFQVLHWDEPGISEGKDAQDWVYSPAWWPPWPGGCMTGVWSEVDGFKLESDCRPANSTSTVTFYVALGRGAVTFNNVSNSLAIEIGVPDWGYAFEGENVYVTVNGQTYDAKTTSTIDLPPMTGTYQSGEVYLTGTISFSPIPVPPAPVPQADTDGTSSITATSATLWGRLLEDGGQDCQYRFSYWRDAGAVQHTNWSCCVKGGQTFSALLSNLEPDCRYSFCAEAKNSAGASAGPTNSFVTETASAQPPAPPAPPAIKPPVNLNPNWGKKNPAMIGYWRNFPPDKTLYVENLWEGCNPDSNAGSWALTLMPGSDEYLGTNDLMYGRETLADINSMVTSLLVRSNGSTIPGMIDARAVLPEKLVINVAFDSKTGSAVYFDPAKTTRNHLSLSYPVKYGNTNVARPFDGKIISLGVNDPNSPRWDVHKLITEQNGVFELLPLKGSYAAKAAYTSFVLYGGFALTDVDLNGKTDSNDYHFVQSKLGFVGPTSADVWGPLGLGMPDGKVDSNDVDAIYKVLTPEEQKKVVPPQAQAQVLAYSASD